MSRRRTTSLALTLDAERPSDVRHEGLEMNRRTPASPPLTTHAERATPRRRRMARIKLAGSVLLLTLVTVAAAMSLL